MKIKLPRHILQTRPLMKQLEQILSKSHRQEVESEKEREREREREFSIRECIKRPYNMLINIHYLN